MNLKNFCIWIDADNISLKTIINMARAKIVLLDQSSKFISTVCLSQKTIVIQLWHSGGLYKKVGFNAFRIGYDKAKEYKRIKRIHGQIDFFIISDRKLIPYYADAFHLNPDHILPLGLARTDLLYQCDRQQVKEHFGDLYPETKGKKILLYAPTFRTESGKRYCGHSMPDIDFLSKKLGTEWCFVFRLHPTLVGKISVKKGWIDISEYDYVDSIILSDALVTDYSSILFDFSLTGRPVFLYINDIYEYISSQRTLYVCPENIVSRYNIAYTDDDLVKVIMNNNKNSNSIFDRYMSACDGKSTLRIVNFIEDTYRRRSW